MENKGIKKLLLWGVMGCMLPGGEAIAQQGSGRQLALTDIVSGSFDQRGTINDMRSLPDGEHYTAMNPDRSAVIKYAWRTGKAVDTLFDARRARESSFNNFDDYLISPTGHHILIYRDTESIYRRSSKATVYDYDVRRNYLKPLTDTGKKMMVPLFSPDGRMCAYVIDNNIFLKKFDYDTEVQVTTDGLPGNGVLNGISDWVYEEEFAVTCLMAWSPDGGHLAYVRLDESGVKGYDMQMYGDGFYPTLHRFKYPKAGERNAAAVVCAYNTDTKDTKVLTPPAGDEVYIPRITFAPGEDKLAVFTLNRHQNIFNLYYANPKSGVWRLVHKEESKTYLEPDYLLALRFTPAGFVCLSERNGWAHLYMHSPTGVLQRQITNGQWDVTALLGIDPSTGAVYYQSAQEGPLQRSVYKIDAKGKQTRLSTAPGTNNAVFSASLAYYLHSHSSQDTPTLITVHQTDQAKPLRIIEDNMQLKQRMAGYTIPEKEFIRLATASGQMLNGWIVRPPHFDESRQYPLVMMQYSGPGSQQVLDRFGIGWEHYLASRGIIVACVDGRGTGARGEAFKKCTYLRLGELESTDQVEAANALGEFPYIDKRRIAIWGWSFGGYNVLMSMSRGSETFKAGIAVAPVTDWRFYDTVYTERFMREPKENPAGYDSSSPIQRAEKLQGRLLLVHGTGDDNVHFMQTLSYAEALVQAGKSFDMQVYKDRRHGISGDNTRLHLYSTMTDFLFRHLQ